MKKIIIAAALALSVSACSSNYEIGDLSERYCAASNAEIRATIKADLELRDIEIGADYCTAYTVVKVVKDLR